MLSEGRDGGNWRGTLRACVANGGSRQCAPSYLFELVLVGFGRKRFAPPGKRESKLFQASFDLHAKLLLVSLRGINFQRSDWQWLSAGACRGLHSRRRFLSSPQVNTSLNKDYKPYKYSWIHIAYLKVLNIIGERENNHFLCHSEVSFLL